MSSDDLFKHYKSLSDQLWLKRQKHSGTWKIISNSLGKKEHAQDELNKIKQSLRLLELMEDYANFYDDKITQHIGNLFHQVLQESKT